MPARKGKRAADSAASETPSAKAAKTDSAGGAEGTPVKRGRGRPRLEESAKKSKQYVKSGKPRGRPKKSESAKASPAKKAAITAKKSPAKTASSAKKTDKKPKAPGSRGRGRPRKSVEPAEESTEEASAEAISDSEEQTDKKPKASGSRGRGRPRKSVEPAEESTEEASAEAISDSEEQSPTSSDQDFWEPALPLPSTPFANVPFALPGYKSGYSRRNKLVRKQDNINKLMYDVLFAQKKNLELQNSKLRLEIQTLEANIKYPNTSDVCVVEHTLDTSC